jgi:hypothetical protein
MIIRINKRNLITTLGETMKLILAISLLSLSVSAIANCKSDARNIAEEAVRLFDVNDQDIHCLAAGGLTGLKSLPVIMVMPQRYAYEATFNFPCGPQPKSPTVTMLLNKSCKIVNLKVTGFDL